MTSPDEEETLARFWQIATRPIPIVVVGGGRWARVWASVITAARGSGEGVAVAARTDTGSARAWAEELRGASGLIVVPDLRHAMTLTARPSIAVVASRPRDHVPDALAAIEQGLDVLVEKPLSDRAAGGLDLISAARRSGRILALGTEFAFLPAFHRCARDLKLRPAEAISIRLEWNDRGGEVRHGAAKRRHEEVGVVLDLFAHAVSIFRIFAPDRPLHVLDVWESTSSHRGFVRLGDSAGGCFELACDVASDARRRMLTIVAGRRARVDFERDSASVEIDGHAVPPPSAAASFDSTLRLQLGALFMEVAGAIEGTAITRNLTELMLLQSEVERALRA